MSNFSLDSHKLLHHLDVLNAWIRGERIYPMYVAISPSGTCNHRCIFCAYNYLENKPVFLEKHSVFRLLGELGGLGAKAAFFSGEGEPFLNKALPEMIEHARENNIDAAINTNGVLFTKDMAERLLKHLTFLRVSFNAGRKETYARVHGTSEADFNRVLENISAMAEIKKRDSLDVTIGVQCLLLNENRFEIVEHAENLKAAGADYLAIKPFLDHPDITYRLDYSFEDQDLAKHLEEAEALSDKDFQVIVRRASLQKVAGRTYDRCLSLPFMCEVDCHGDVYPCGPYLGHKDMVYGNIHEHTFKEIWDGQQGRAVMDAICRDLDVHKCMPNCRNDAVNRFLWELEHQPAHVTFI